MSIEVAVASPERAATHLDRLYRLALSLCGSRHLAEDLVQEAYARMLARPRRLRGAEEFPYLARIVRNLLYDHHHRSRRIVLSDPPPEDQWPAGDESDPETSARTRELFALVGALPPGQRDAVAAVDVAGLTYRQAARALGVPIGTVMSRLARGRTRLARELG
ncbi:MAG TPA: RNA polymerase sigma factor [Thermoleophilaceae bacterium]|jgi:RNA polymerase sigma-70 factor (ECF subfamily)